MLELGALDTRTRENILLFEKSLESAFEKDNHSMCCKCHDCKKLYDCEGDLITVFLYDEQFVRSRGVDRIRL